MANLLENLNDAQRAAVTHGSGPLLIVAGAGTGKTTVIVNRIAWLIEQGLAKPEEILALTFTDKTANEMVERIDRLLPLGYYDLWVSTFHAFGERMLRAHGLDIGLPHDFKVLSATDQWVLLRKNLARLDLKHYRPLGNPTKFIAALLDHFSRAADERVGPAEYLQHVKSLQLNGDDQSPDPEVARLSEVANAYHIYKQLLRELGALDFADLINETLRLFTERPAILEQYRKKFKFIIVDEFQDTNQAQYELLRMLSEPARNITVVGDDDQSIYKFRGAAISNILAFEKDYPGVKKVILTGNYRSTQDILDVAYSFIQNNNPHRLESTLGISKKLSAARPGPSVIEHLHGKTLEDEARLVVKKLSELKTKDPTALWNDFAILVRANDHAEPFLRTLELAGIPHEFSAARGLYTDPVVIDILSYLRVLVDPFDSPSMYRLLTSAFIRIPHADLSAIIFHANRKAMQLIEMLRMVALAPGLAPTTVATIQKMIHELDEQAIEARREPVGKIILHFLHQTPYLKEMLASDPTGRVSKVLAQFWKRVENFAAIESEPTTKNFVDQVALETSSGDFGEMPFDPEAGPELVRVMSVHAAKGLEFRWVFIVNLVDRRFPTSERAHPIPLPEAFIKETLTGGDEHLEEERRLFYVGMTRAKDGLFLTSAEDYGGARKKKPSRFLIEAGFIKTPEPHSTNALEQTYVPTPAEEFHPMLPKKFSHTQIKSFDTCPLQYKFAHLMKIPVRGKPALSFGRSIHRALQKFIELSLAREVGGAQTLFGPAGSSERPGWDDLERLYRESWIEDWYPNAEDREERFRIGLVALEKYYERLAGAWPRVKATEQTFTLKLGALTLSGVIDRIDELPDGTVSIIDYKTGRAKTEKTVDWDQLLIYHLAAEQVMGLKPSKLVYDYLEEGTTLETVATPEMLDDIKTRLEKIHADMMMSAFPATPAPQSCAFCDFKDICEFRAI